ncbi:uncharacterized protein LOC143027670 isoform X2 [Oratosquilla oratoria]|uniref:uncharacterized protein LOC143027670 isoform X2 n=1 Tax=Oratosquilla oratoria TaxID=337810 RepID=UPI003F75E911
MLRSRSSTFPTARKIIFGLNVKEHPGRPSVGPAINSSASLYTPGNDEDTGNPTHADTKEENKKEILGKSQTAKSSFRDSNNVPFSRRRTSLAPGSRVAKLLPEGFWKESEVDRENIEKVAGTMSNSVSEDQQTGGITNDPASSNAYFPQTPNSNENKPPKSADAVNDKDLTKFEKTDEIRQTQAIQSENVGKLSNQTKMPFGSYRYEMGQTRAKRRLDVTSRLGQMMQDNNSDDKNGGKK